MWILSQGLRRSRWRCRGRGVEAARVRGCRISCPGRLPFLPLPTPATASTRHRPPSAFTGTDGPARPLDAPFQPNQTPLHPGLVPGLRHSSWALVVTMEYKGRRHPVLYSATPSALAQDFARHQVSKQQRLHYHSSSLSSSFPNTMVSQSVNKTGLHPAGVQYGPFVFEPIGSSFGPPTDAFPLDPQKMITPRSRRSSMTAHTSTMTA